MSFRGFCTKKKGISPAIFMNILKYSYMPGVSRGIIAKPHIY